MIHRSQLATWPWKIIINTLLQGFCSFLLHQYFRTLEYYFFYKLNFCTKYPLIQGSQNTMCAICSIQTKLIPLNAFSDNSEDFLNYYSG